MESLLHHATELKRMYNSNEWQEYHNSTKRREEVVEVLDLISQIDFGKGTVGLYSYRATSENLKSNRSR